MIRINLLGRSRPKATRPSVPLEATLQYILLVIALAVSGGALYGHYLLLDRENTKVVTHIQKQTSEKARLEQLKQQVDNYEKQKAVLQQRINVIEELQRNRTGGQELLEAIANTVSRTDTLWLTSVDRKGNDLTINGSAGSLNAVANYITQLKRSGYFQTVEIKESHQDSSNKTVQIFVFSLTTQFGLPQSGGPTMQTGGKAVPTGGAAPAAPAPAPAGTAAPRKSGSV
ncbi:MAG TPA: PilN domain-containing protein [Candidatus Sulfotelmatobacter sp.]|jgi:Tfp pilus assembly protein PilN|nr:PilN domain-containing protein [Candidatus Sulfotelmatobacter sp.]